jgi:hypothetical protein
MRFRLTSLLAVTFTLLLGAGCSDVKDPASPQPTSLYPLNPAIKAVDAIDTDWNLVASKTVSPGITTQVTGSRYTLTFQPLSLVDSLSVTIRERNANTIDVEFGPDGSTFYKPVTLQISYRGTAFDSEAAGYSGRTPKLFWFNPESGIWQIVPGTDDPRNCVYTVSLAHFSRYAMGDGTSGWEDAADRDKDSIK